jgi:hypothetical protein
MAGATARCRDGTSKKKGRERHIPGLFQNTLNGTDKDKASDWRTQHIASRHRVTNCLAREIVRAHFGEGADND